MVHANYTHYCIPRCIIEGICNVLRSGAVLAALLAVAVTESGAVVAGVARWFSPTDALGAAEYHSKPGLS